MELWRAVWRRGLAPQLGAAALAALADALEWDDPVIVQGVTTTPLGMHRDPGAPVVACCPLAYCGVVSGHDTVCRAEAWFAAALAAAGRAVGESSAGRHFTNWVDETERGEMRCQLLHEVRLELARRAG